jgi:mannose-1-phosphate guanylyltransferase
MPLINAPLLEYQLSYLRDAGVEQVCFATNYRADDVERVFGDGSRFGVKLTYAVESEPLDTAGAIRNAYDAMPGDDCIVFNGDTVHGFDIASIVDRHSSRGADVTLALKRVERPHPYGVVPIDDEYRVLKFDEPSEEQKRAVGGPATGEFDAINAGLYVMAREALEAIPQGRSNIERDVFPAFIADGRRVCGDIQDDFWIDIGRPSQYREAVRAVLTGLVAPARPISIVGDSAIDPGASVAGDANVSEGSSISGGCVLESGAQVRDSVVLESSRVCAGASLTGSIVCEDCIIGAGSRVVNSAIAPGTVLPENSVLGSID